MVTFKGRYVRSEVDGSGLGGANGLTPASAKRVTSLVQ